MTSLSKKKCFLYKQILHVSLDYDKMLAHPEFSVILSPRRLQRLSDFQIYFFTCVLCEINNLINFFLSKKIDYCCTF